MPGTKLLNNRVCDIRSVESRLVVLPYAAVKPYSAWVVDGSSVVQLIVAPDVVMLELLIEPITGGVVSGGGASVVKVWSPEVAGFPAASTELTR